MEIRESIEADPTQWTFCERSFIASAYANLAFPGVNAHIKIGKVLSCCGSGLDDTTNWKSTGEEFKLLHLMQHLKPCNCANVRIVVQEALEQCREMKKT